MVYAQQGCKGQIIFLSNYNLQSQFAIDLFCFNILSFDYAQDDNILEVPMVNKP